MKTLTEIPRLALALEHWRGMPPQSGGADMLSPLVSRLVASRPGILAHIFFGTRGTDIRFTFMGTEAAETLKVDSLHGPQTIDASLGTLGDLVSSIDLKRGAACLHARTGRGGFDILVLPTGPDSQGAPGFLGVCEEASTAPGAVPLSVNYLDVTASAGTAAIRAAR